MDILGWGGALEPAPVVLFRRVGADKKDPVGRHAAHREIADQPAALVQHRCQRDTADVRHLVRHDPIEPGGGAWAGNVELAVVGRFEQADPGRHRVALSRHVRVRVRPAERDLLDRRRALRRKPQRVLEGAVVAEHGVLRLKPLIDRRRAKRACGRQLLVRKADPEAP